MPASYLRTTLLFTILLITMSLEGCGGLRSTMVSAMPEATVGQLEASLPKVVAEVKTRPNVVNHNAKRQANKNSMFLAPVVYSFGWDFQPDSFPSAWNPTLKSISFQNNVDWIQYYLREGLKTRGIGTLGSEWFVKNNVAIDKVGVNPVADKVMLDRKGDFMNSFTFAANKSRELRPQDYGKLTFGSSGWGGGIYVKIHGAWDYDGHVRINGEPVVIYDVMEWYIVTVCDASNSCESVTVGDGAPLGSKRGIPSEVAIDEKMNDELTGTATKASAKITAETVLAIIDAMLLPAK